MAVESEPLFHPEVIRQHLRSFNLADSVEDQLVKEYEWTLAELAKLGGVNGSREPGLVPAAA